MLNGNGCLRLYRMELNGVKCVCINVTQVTPLGPNFFHHCIYCQ